MIKRPQDSRASAWKRLLVGLFAIGIGPSLIAAVIAILSWQAGAIPDLSEEESILAVNAAIISFPFVVIALLGTTQKAPWLVGLALTLALWGYALYDVLVGPFEGANIGLGLLVVSSPIIITMVCLVVRGWSEKPETHPHCRTMHFIRSEKSTES